MVFNVISQREETAEKGLSRTERPRHGRQNRARNTRTWSQSLVNKAFQVEEAEQKLSDEELEEIEAFQEDLEEAEEEVREFLEEARADLKEKLDEELPDDIEITFESDICE